MNDYNLRPSLVGGVSVIDHDLLPCHKSGLWPRSQATVADASAGVTLRLNTAGAASLPEHFGSKTHSSDATDLFGYAPQPVFSSLPITPRANEKALANRSTAVVNKPLTASLTAL